jgi:ComF family protein
VAWLYDERAAAVIAAFKYDGRPRLAEFMGAALASSVHLGAVDFVTAVPMHPTRRRERGFDHTAELTRVCARMTGLPMLDGVLERTRFAAPQARLRPAARRKAVRDTVAVRNREAVRGRRIVVVDDVITTGATLEACLAVLEAEGARACGLALAWAQ